VVLAIGHTLRAHEALGRPDALSGLPEVVHRLFEDGVFICHDRSIRAGGIFRSLDCLVFSCEHADWALLRKREQIMGLLANRCEVSSLHGSRPFYPKLFSKGGYRIKG
jgi:hypothetical protein